MSESPTSRAPRGWVLTLGVAVVSAAAFISAFPGGWIYDDRPLIAENPTIQTFRGWLHWFTTDFWQVSPDIVEFGNRLVYWRPSITVSYAIDWQLGGGSPAMFHLTNTLAQAAVGALAFVVLRRWIGATWPALLAALLFAVHPTKAESVAWIAGRTDVFCMIAILVATIGIGRRLRGERGGLALEVLGTVFAYTTKEQALVLPIFVAVEVWVAAGRPAIDRRLVVAIARKAWPQSLLAFAYLAARALLLPIRAAGIEATHQALPDRAQTVLESFGWFTQLAVKPFPLSIQQALVLYKPDATPAHSAVHVVLGVLLLAVTLLGSWRLRRRFPGFAIGMGFFVLTLVPTSNLVSTQMTTLVSERFLYLPILGLALLVGLVLARVRRPALGFALASLVVASFAAVSFARSRDYVDEQRFWARELELHPNSLTSWVSATHIAVEHREYRRALAMMMEMKQHVYSGDGLVHPLLVLGYDVAAVAARLIPDRDVASLRSIEGFARTLLEESAPVATLTTPVVSFSYPLSMRSFKSAMEKRGIRIKLLALRADLLGRLGDDAGAVASSDAARARCALCLSVAPLAALSYARAGRYPEALEILDEAARVLDAEAVLATRGHIERAFAAREQSVNLTGPPRLQAHATELAQLELWGRAYAVLAPYQDEIKRAPRFARGFAELAYRAGYEEVARDVLAVDASPAQIDAAIAAWALEMGWQ